MNTKLSNAAALCKLSFSIFLSSQKLISQFLRERFLTINFLSRDSTEFVFLCVTDLRQQ